MFGPVYHGTTEERQENIGNEGFEIYIGEANTGEVAHGYLNQPYHEGIPAPIHTLGFGIYFTTAKAIAKQFAGGTARGMKTYYLDVPNLETINFGVPKTMMKWWVGQGYDPQLAKTNRVEATKKLTENLKSKYDAVWFKGKGLHKLLDGDQICVFDPSRVYQVDPNLAKPGDVGSKVKRLADGMKGTIMSARSIPEDIAQQYWGGETRVYSVKWTKGGTDNNVKGSQIEFLGAPKAQGATASKVAAFYCVACDGGDCIEHESLTAAVKSNINKLTFESEENNDEYDGWTITAWAPDRMPRPYAQYEGPVGFINIGIEGASIEGPYVYDINVEDDWRGTGLGQQLYDLAVAEAKKRGYTEFNSSTDQTPEAKAAWKRLSQRYQVTRKRDKTENLPYFSLKLAAVADDVEIKVTPKQKGLEAEVWLGDQKVGFVYFHLMEDAPGNPTCPPNSLMVDAAAVSGSVQRQGVGLKMYRTLIEASGKAGYDRLYEGIDHSEEAIGLWEKLKAIYPTEFDEDWGVYYIPLRRSKTAAEGFNDEGFWAGEGNAASGVLPICTTTQRICLAWRSPDVHIGDCWGTIGGACKPKMSLAESAKAELKEETGFSGGITMHPAFVFQSGSFSYHNFLGTVGTEFRFNPQSDAVWETTGLEWFTWDEIQQMMKEDPSDFHPGVISLFKSSGKKIEQLLGKLKTASGDDGDEPNPLQVFPERPDVIETFRHMRPFERDRLIEEAPIEMVNPADLKTNQRTVTKKTVKWFMDNPEEIRKPRSNVGLSDTEQLYPLVCKTSEGYWLYDGNHRSAAALKLGMEIEAKIVDLTDYEEPKEHTAAAPSRALKLYHVTTIPIANDIKAHGFKAKDQGMWKKYYAPQGRDGIYFYDDLKYSEAYASVIEGKLWMKDLETKSWDKAKALKPEMAVIEVQVPEGVAITTNEKEDGFFVPTADLNKVKVTGMYKFDYIPTEGRQPREKFANPLLQEDTVDVEKPKTKYDKVCHAIATDDSLYGYFAEYVQCSDAFEDRPADSSRVVELVKSIPPFIPPTSRKCLYRGETIRMGDDRSIPTWEILIQ